MQAKGKMMMAIHSFYIGVEQKKTQPVTNPVIWESLYTSACTMYVEEVTLG